MTPRCLVLVPTLGRPQHPARLARSVREADPRCETLFLCTPGDDDTIRECQRSSWTIVVSWKPGDDNCGADWARKNNLGYELARTNGFEWALLGGDDVSFHPGWFEACLNAADRHPGGACVVGTNDMGNERVKAGRHSTHPLVHTDYIECGGVVDDPARLLPEVYGHWFVDDEFVQTAQARRCYVHAFDALVEHLHPAWGKAPSDDTYRRGQRSVAEDRAIFEERQRLWKPQPPRTAGRRRG